MKRLFILLLVLFFSCRKDQGNLDQAGYPDEVGKIVLNKCATSGCHNTASKDACVGQDFSSWDKLFQGGRNNSSVVPFRADESFFLYAVNTFDDLGPKLSPVMPVGKSALTRSEVETLRGWISSGAPRKDGFVKWSDDPEREKIYVVNQGCDLLTVFDAKTKLIMRQVDVGCLPSTEAPHDMYVSPDGKNLYVSFFASSIFQRFRTTDGART